jgi:NAD(P)H-dependent glutamate synthase small subunit
MGKFTGFITYSRQEAPKRPVDERIQDHREFVDPLTASELEIQAARCMDCGIPFCHIHGCPVKNLIPDWNDMVYKKKWRRALDRLHATNNLPEITGRVCPAPCEPACTLAINQPAVTIKQIELQIVEHGWEQGWIEPEPPHTKTGKKVAIVGSGPAGLAAAQQLARGGHEVVLFERSDRLGGLLRYGIPEFKLEKWVIDRRIEQMIEEGIVFETGVEAGVDISGRYMRRTFDAILLTTGAGVPRDLEVPGRELGGIHFAMEFLVQQNRRNEGEILSREKEILATGKNVVVVGGGDTGSDCIGTARRQGAREIVQIEILSKPPAQRRPDNPWPTWPQTLSVSSSQEEGCKRLWDVATKAFVGREGSVQSLRCVRVEWSKPDEAGRRTLREIPGSDFELEAELVLLAMGFLHLEHGPLVRELELETDDRGNLRVDGSFMTPVPGVFAAGDSVTGASLVVGSIDSGRLAAAAIDSYLCSA